MEAFCYDERMNNDNDGVGVVVGIVVIIFVGWWFFTSIGNHPTGGESDSSVDNYSSTREEEPEEYYESQGYDCTGDCSGHDAGYEWAQDNDVCDDSYSYGNSQSFDEGVQVYAEENC